VYLATFRALGANPVAMDPSELYLALQQGVVDGFEYPLPDLVAQRMYEVSKFLSLDRHTTDFFIVSTSVKSWNGFSAQEQGWITQAMKTAADWQWKEQPQQIAQALDQAQDADDGQRDLAREQEAVRRRHQARLRAVRADDRQGLPQPLHQGTELGPRWPTSTQPPKPRRSSQRRSPRSSSGCTARK
jgi:TRAP-type C4-dicarboxylate transport system substrate-binding protein